MTTQVNDPILDKVVWSERMHRHGRELKRSDRVGCQHRGRFKKLRLAKVVGKILYRRSVLWNGRVFHRQEKLWSPGWATWPSEEVPDEEVFRAIVACPIHYVNTPTLIQSITSSTSQNGAGDWIQGNLPNPTLLNNFLIVFTFGPSSVTINIPTDNKSSTNWTRGKSGVSGTDQAVVFYNFAIPAGITQVTVSNTNVTSNYLWLKVSEWTSVALSSPADGAGDSTVGASSTNWTATAFSTAVDGDLIYQGVTEEAAVPWNGASITKGAGFTLLTSNIIDGSAEQWRVQTTHGSITPAMTASSASVYISLSHAFKPDPAAGTAPASGIRIVKVLHNNVWNNTSPQVLQLPCTGNLLVVVWDAASTVSNTSEKLTGVTDTASNTWAQAGTGTEVTDIGGARYNSQIFYAANAATSGDHKITLTWQNSSTSTGVRATFYDIIGASASPFDTVNAFPGNDTVSSDTLATGTITPTWFSGVAIAQLQIETDFSIVGMSAPPGALFDNFVMPNMPSISQVDMNNGNCHVYYSDIIPLNFTWNKQATGQIDHYNFIAATFKGPNSSPETATHFLFRKDDGTEITATNLAPQDTDVTSAALTPMRLRMQADTLGDRATEAMKLKFRKTDSWDYRTVK